MNYITNILRKEQLNANDLEFIIGLEDTPSIQAVKSKAYSVLNEYVGECVYLRGLIEFSNICVNDCYYCGIRKSNHNIKKFTLEQNEIIEAALWAAENGYGSIVLQSGERNDNKFIELTLNVINDIKRRTVSDLLPDGLGITLCIGEQTYSTYKQLFDAGAHRYLLRIETSNPELYASIHSPDQSYEYRLECLNMLKQIGYQVGTGVMIGIPGQSIADLADDIIFFKQIDADMIGMGPFIIHSDALYSNLMTDYNEKKKYIYQKSLLMIAAARLYLKDVNIAATTALQALYPMGREAGLEFGANVIMPLLTPTYVRGSYQLYNGKPCIDEFSSDCFDCIKRRVESVGRTVSLNEWGDSLHFKSKKS